MSSALATSADFDRCHPKTAAWEGGWSNHANDPGGKTMYGISQAVFWEWLDSKGLPRRPVSTITRMEALAIFYNNYWVKAGCEGLVPGVDLAVYDASVNSGVSRGRKWLLASVGSNDHAKTVKAICAKLLGFVQSLNIWKTFGKGWGNRIADIEATGVAWALAAMTANDNGQVVIGLRDEQAAARQKAAAQTKGAATSGAAGAGSGVTLGVDPASVDYSAGWLLGGLLFVGVTLGAFLIIRAVINRQRAAAYALIDGYLFGRYALPIAPAPTLLVDLSQRVAIYFAHGQVASEKIRKDYDDALKTLAQIAANTIRLQVGGVEPPANAAGDGEVLMTDTDRPMTVESMKGYI